MKLKKYLIIEGFDPKGFDPDDKLKGVQKEVDTLFDSYATMISIIAKADRKKAIKIQDMWRKFIGLTQTTIRELKK